MPTNLDLELQERLGHSSMTEVWKAFDPQLQRSVAVKLFHADLLNDPDFMARYQNLPRVGEAKSCVCMASISPLPTNRRRPRPTS